LIERIELIYELWFSAFIKLSIKRELGTVGAAFPAVPLTKGRVRFCVSASHTKEMLDQALEVINEIGDQVAIKYSKTPKTDVNIVY